jgi:hypothetical protein
MTAEMGSPITFSNEVQTVTTMSGTCRKRLGSRPRVGGERVSEDCSPRKTRSRILRAIGTYLEVAGHRYEGNQMPRLCESTGYPLDRRTFQAPFAGGLSVRTALAEPPALNVSVQRRKPGGGRQRVRLPRGGVRRPGSRASDRVKNRRDQAWRRL